MPTKERRSLWFDWFGRRLLSLSKYTNRLPNRLVSLSNHRHRSNASDFVDHHPKHYPFRERWLMAALSRPCTRLNSRARSTLSLLIVNNTSPAIARYT
jgi:hypothetical protein